MLIRSPDTATTIAYHSVLRMAEASRLAQLSLENKLPLCCFCCVDYIKCRSPIVEVAPQTKDVSAGDVERIVTDDTGTLIDVRNPNELEETGKIGDAINVPRK